MMIHETIVGASYIGMPKNHTAMFITKKVSYLLENLSQAEGCLVFAETGIDVPVALQKNHEFRFSPYPQLEYADFVSKFEQIILQRNSQRKYLLTNSGYYIGENTTIGENAIIEPLCFIGHDVVIGKNAHVMTGAKIKNAIIGDGFIAGENCTIGTYGFAMTRDLENNNMRVPTLGQVIIGSNVEVGTLTNISCSSSGETMLDDYVKTDASVYIAHDVHIHKNAKISSGVTIAGFVDIGEDVSIGVNAAIRNRITIGAGTVIGMGAVVTKSVPCLVSVVGNPAKPLRKKT